MAGLPAGQAAGAAAYPVPRNLLRPVYPPPDPRRGALAAALGVLAWVLSRGPQPHVATVRAFVLALRGQGFSAGRLARRYGVSPRQVRAWCEPGALAAPKASRVVRAIRAHAAQLAGRKGVPMGFDPGTMPGLLDAAVAAQEAQRREDDPGYRAGLSDVSDAAERLWPSVRGKLAGRERTSVLSTVRGAVMAVLAARGFTQEAIGEAVGRSRSTVSYRVGGAS